MLPSEPTPLSPQQRCSIRVQTDIVYNVHISGDQSPRKYPGAGMKMVQKQQLTCEASTTPRTCGLSDRVQLRGWDRISALGCVCVFLNCLDEEGRGWNPVPFATTTTTTTTATATTTTTTTTTKSSMAFPPNSRLISDQGLHPDASSKNVGLGVQSCECFYAYCLCALCPE